MTRRWKATHTICNEEEEGWKMGSMYRYEYKDEKSHKFWQYEVNVRNGLAEVSWGRVGTRGQSQLVEIGEAEQRAYKKVQKGYVPVDREMPIPVPVKEVERGKKRGLSKKSDMLDMWDEFAKGGKK